MPPRLTIAPLMLDIETAMDAEQTIAEIEWLERIFAVPDTRPLSPSRPLGCESTARRDASQQSVVSSVAELWGFAAEVKRKEGLGFRASAAFPGAPFQQLSGYTLLHNSSGCWTSAGVTPARKVVPNFPLVAP
jgi:hypothetical protein